MIELAAPLALLLLPLPVLVFWLAPPHKQRMPALRLPFFHRYLAAAGVAPSDGAQVVARPLWVVTAAM